MSTESHPSPSGSSTSSLFGGGGNNTGANEPSTQQSPARPTWAQILNSNASSGSSNPNAANHTSSSSSPSSQHSANNKVKTNSPSTNNVPRSAPPSNVHDQQQQQQPQSQMNWSLNFNQTTPWMIDDDSQRHSNAPNHPSQPSIDNDQTFDRLESSSPSSEWNKPVSSTNSAGNGWSNFQPQQQSAQQQQQQQNNPSRSTANSNQWLDMNNFYGTNFSQHPNETTTTTSSSNTWQDPSSGNADTLSSSSTNNPSVMSKHKTQSSSSSMSGVVKSQMSLASGSADLPGGPNDTMINYVPQPKLVEQLGWDEPDIQVTKRPNFDDGTSIWGDPMDVASVPVKKWTNGSKAALNNPSNTSLPQGTPPPAAAAPAAPVSAPIPPSQAIVQKPVSTGATTTSLGLTDDDWPKTQSPTLGQPASAQWNESGSATSLDPSGLNQGGPFRNPSNNWNTHTQHPGNSHPDDWFREGVVDTSGWGLQGPQHKVPFDPYEGTIDTTGWGMSSGGGMGGPMPGMARTRFPMDYENPHDPHQVRMSSYENSSFNDPYRQTPDGKNPMMGLGNILPLSSNMPASQHPFVPRPSPLYPGSSDTMLRPINPTGGLSTPPGAMMNQGNLMSPKLPTSSPVPSQAYVPMSGKPSTIPTHPSQTATQSQQHLPGNGNNPNGNNNGAVHAQIMQQFRLAVQAGLISQDLLNTKLPPYMLQLLQRLFELQQKFQAYSFQLSELNKQKARFPVTVFQNEYDRLSKSINQKKQEMLTVQKEIQDAHGKLKQQQGSGVPSNSSPMTTNPDQSRLRQWTNQSNQGGGGRPGMFPPPPGLTPKDWQTDNHDSNDNWEQSQSNESNANNQMGAFNDPFTGLTDDIDGPPPFFPGQPWNWKPQMPSADDDPHVTPSSFIVAPKGLSSAMGNLNVGGGESAFSNPQMMHPYQRHPQQSNRSQWQHDPQAFPGAASNDWNKQGQQQQQGPFRGSSKAPHPSFGGGYRPYS